MISSLLPRETEQRLRAELKSGERLLWTAQPICNRAWYPSIPVVVFAILWTLFWLCFVVSLPAFGVPFILLGVWMLSLPFWMRRKAQKTVYALTDQRALILTPASRNGVTVRSIPPEDLSARTRTQNPDGSGTLIFTRLTTMQRRAGPDGGTYAVTVGFENITDVRAVEALIERTFHAPEPSSPDPV
jgi:hypothetical protein